MPAYHYTALNADRKELNGIIEAPDEQIARKKLNELKLSVVLLNQIESAEHAPKTDKIIFEFEAFDKKHKKVIGTITSEDIVKAYGRLFDEYQLDVTAIFPSALTPEQKQTEKNEGILNIQKQYDRLNGKQRKEEYEARAALQAHEVEQKELLGKIEFTMQKIQNFLQKSGADLKPDQRETIQAYINQLFRIKDSTNLDHIRTTCEKMLNHIQQQELFIHEEQRLRESSQLKMETKEMLYTLKQTGLKQDITLSRILDLFRSINFLKPISDSISSFFEEKNPEIAKLKTDLKIANQHIWTYVKMFITAKSNLYRQESWESIKTLLKEKKRLKLSLEALKPQTNTDAFWENASSITGWILSFYLLSYIVAYPFTIKNFNVGPMPENFYFYSTTITKFATIFLMVVYCAIMIRNFWLKQHWIAVYILYPATFLGFLLILTNLM